MRKVHFYKARSRLGIINPIINTKDLNVGVEDAPDAILTPKFLSKFNNPQVSEFVFSKPEALTVKDSSHAEPDQNDIPTKYFDVLARELSLFKNLINKTLQPRETQVVIGGDNSITFSSLLAVLQRAGNSQKVGYIQFDSHGEMNMYKTSPSKNFHGMYMKPFLDSFDVPKIKSLINTKLMPSRTLFIGDLDLDTEERVYFRKTKLGNITREMVLKDKDKLVRELKDFILDFDYLHINFDIDILSSREALATGIPALRGFMFDEISSLLKVVSSHPNLSMDLSEVNPQKEGSKKTIDIAQKVLETLLSI